MGIAENKDYKVGLSTIWTERVVPTEYGEVYIVGLYRKQKGNYGVSFPTYMSTSLKKRTRKELARILRNLNKDYHIGDTNQ